ncbi:MAG: NUDIX domain-containing protein [Rubinisphaera brasiliensis]|uniref:8-oxo-dGTP diphosphatase n=1 Tax=Rubinisphaera brasiliensis (strain ATCC 49424 / DSM 5305 / JCM 21570 / IAM 15109 / NBRC 103401 / IFAM 1448) TaxID=756272 RepID=F0SRD2_RUBBR|nr:MULTISPECIES: NUDIX domain-containing protein [Rubinisphaera]ADY57993.1 NUDIX hydrolase [Rubinisphaera brasiliensis DSM 5305]MBB02560.1 ADP-ribose pyrophosphatase [Planctomyces sp.]MBR9802279.1 NUDIX domain-containing protein [bacterium]
MMTKIGIALVESQGHFLVGIRPEGKPLAGLHEFPGGKQIIPESTNETAVRECLEETGLEVVSHEMLHQQSFVYQHDEVQLDFWRCEMTDELLELPEVRSPWRWVPVSELQDLTFPAANDDILAILQRRRTILRSEF